MAEYITRVRTSSGIKQIDYESLANKPTVPEIDTTLTISGRAADAKAVGDKLKTIQSDINSVSLSTFGVTATVTELNYMDGVVKNVQDQINNIQGQLANKADKNHTHDGLTGSTDVAQHTHSTNDITSGVLSIDRVPIIPVSSGGTGAVNATDALSNLGIETGTWTPNPHEVDTATGNYSGNYVKINDMITVTFYVNGHVARTSADVNNYFYIHGEDLPYAPDKNTPLFFGSGTASGLCTLDPNDCFVGWAIDTNENKIYARTMYVQGDSNDNVHGSRYMYSPSVSTMIYLAGSITYKIET